MHLIGICLCQKNCEPAIPICESHDLDAVLCPFQEQFESQNDNVIYI